MIYIPLMRKLTREKSRYLKILRFKKYQKKTTPKQTPENHFQVRKVIFIRHLGVFLKIDNVWLKNVPPGTFVHTLTPGTCECYPTWQKVLCGWFRISWCGHNPWLPRWAWLNHNFVLLRGAQEGQTEKTLWWGRQGSRPQAKEPWQLLEAGGAAEQVFSPGALRSNQTSYTSILTLWFLRETFDLQNCERTNSHYFKPLKAWSFVTMATGNS